VTAESCQLTTQKSIDKAKSESPNDHGVSPEPSRMSAENDSSTLSGCSQLILTYDEFDSFIFDFDSTMIKSESLEIMLEEMLAKDPKKNEKMAEIADWTNKGMNGECSFKEGLEARLRIAKPTKQDLETFCEKYCPADFSNGMVELLKDLVHQGKKVFILSGGFTDLIVPFAKYVGIPASRVHAVNINWDKDGAFDSLNEDNGFVASKLEGALKVKDQFTGNVLGVGDGYTDYMLYSEGLATEFIAYIEHATRERVVKVAPRCAKNVDELRSMIALPEAQVS